MTQTPEPGRPRQLDRAPGERYRGATPPTGPGAAPGAGARPGADAPATHGPEGSVRRAVLAAASVGLIVAVGRAVVGQVDLGLGTLAIAAFAGWVVALALVWGAAGTPIRPRALLAAVIAGGAIAAGLVLESLIARMGGGVLGPIDYVNERYGILAYVEIAVAALVAAIRAR
ncbi:MAG TPA: hypothetical protein VGQ83_19470 [Polyangia bacterium]|jgi:hypothetical protein